MKKIRIPTVVAGALFAGMTHAAQLVDQHNDAVPPFQGYVVPFAGGDPTGQEFVPALDGLDFVQLQINDQRGGNGTGFSMHTRIRDGSITGAILGTSLSFAHPDQPMVGGMAPIFLADFQFPSTVALTPGNTYVIEVVPDLGSDPMGVFGTGFGNDAYAGGSAIRAGVPETNPGLGPFDLWFREGKNVPDGSVAWAGVGGLVGLMLLRARR